MSGRSSPIARSEGGFSFIEVIIALSILLVGSVGILTLFAIGVDHQVQRRIEARLQMVLPEIETLAQETVDSWSPDKPQVDAKVEKALSVRNFSVRLRFEPVHDHFPGPGFVAWADLLYQGNVVRKVGPLPVVRSTVDPALVGLPAGDAGAKKGS
jgi:prepilin-type N-terminal cleavage/methylation domain-containing protein